MKPPRKRRPSTFELPPEAPVSPGWTYRSDAPPAKPEPAVAKPAVAKPADMTERVIATIARPFEVALVFLLVPFGRRRGVPLMILALSLAVVAGSCRRDNEEIWTGVEVVDDEMVLQLASPETKCGCVTLTSQVDQPLRLNSRLNEIVLGKATLPPRGSMVARFDWAGENAADVYFISAYDASGRELKFGEVVKVHHSGWMSCSAPACDYGTLLMNAATAAGH